MLSVNWLWRLWWMLHITTWWQVQIYNITLIMMMMMVIVVMMTMVMTIISMMMLVMIMMMMMNGGFPIMSPCSYDPSCPRRINNNAPTLLWHDSHQMFLWQTHIFVWFTIHYTPALNQLHFDMIQHANGLDWQTHKHTSLFDTLYYTPALYQLY